MKRQDSGLVWSTEYGVVIIIKNGLLVVVVDVIRRKKEMEGYDNGGGCRDLVCMVWSRRVHVTRHSGGVNVRQRVGIMLLLTKGAAGIAACDNTIQDNHGLSQPPRSFRIYFFFFLI